MKKRSAYLSIAGLAIAIVVTVFLLQNKASDTIEEEVAETTPQSVEPVPEGRAPGEPLAIATEAYVAPEPTPVAAEEVAFRETLQMYEAHRSLRSPEVDDPDSATNTRIRGQMLQSIFKLAEAHQAEEARKAAQ